VHVLQCALNHLPITPHVGDGAVAEHEQLATVIHPMPHIGVEGIEGLPTAKLGAENRWAPTREERFGGSKKAERVASGVGQSRGGSRHFG
jgi:hypothetical protein